MWSCRRLTRDSGDTRDEATIRRRVEGLRLQLAAMGGTCHSPKGSRLTPAMEEQFLERVIAMELQTEESLFALLTQAGVVMPGPAGLTDVELGVVLDEVIEALARQNVYLLHTDHLSDRELYTLLVTDLFQEKSFVTDSQAGTATILDILGSGSPDDMDIWFAVYAGETERREWRDHFPDITLPPRRRPVRRRDVHLPRPDWI